MLEDVTVFLFSFDTRVYHAAPYTIRNQNVEFCICETILAFNIYICHSRMWNSILFDCRTHPKRLLMKSCYKVAVEFNKANAMRQNSEI
jgi:hypothetical protein